MVSVCGRPVVFTSKVPTSEINKTPATKYNSSMFSSNTPSREQAFPFLWFSKTLEYEKITELKNKQISPAPVQHHFSPHPL